MDILNHLIDVKSLFSFGDLIHIQMPIIFLVKKKTATHEDE